MTTHEHRALVVFVVIIYIIVFLMFLLLVSGWVALFIPWNFKQQHNDQQRWEGVTRARQRDAHSLTVTQSQLNLLKI